MTADAGSEALGLYRSITADLLWIRDPFLNYGGKSEKPLVLGYLFAWKPEIRADRICFDAGAYS